MTTTIEAVYENGLFRPTAKVALAEGTHVEVLIPGPAQLLDPKNVAARLAQLAASSPIRNIADSASETHDEVLYSRKQQP